MMHLSTKQTFTICLTALALILSVSVSHAEPIIFNGANQVKYTDLENEYRKDANGVYQIQPPGTPLQVGDLLQGVLWATTIQQGANQLTPGVNSQQITGLFSYMVAAQDGVSGSFVYAPNTTGSSILSGLGLPANTMIALYTSPNNNWLSQLGSAPDLATVQADAATGQLFGAFGYNYTAYADLGLPNPNGYQFANASNQFFLGHNLLKSDLLTTTPILNPALTLAGSTIPSGTHIPDNESPLGTTKYDLVGEGNVQLNAGASNPIRDDLYAIQSNDPVNINVASLAPEPSSLVLCGISFGSLGVIRLLRRRRNRTETA